MLLFKPVQRKNPQDKNAPMKFYPQHKKSGSVDFKNIAEELSDASTLNSVDVRAVLYGLEKTLIKYLQNGYIVRFGDLGTFRPSVGGSGEDEPELLTAAHVNKVKILFAPSTELKRAVSLAPLKKVQE